MLFRRHPTFSCFYRAYCSLPEYPQSHEQGYAYIVSLEGLSQQQAVHALRSVRKNFYQLFTSYITNIDQIQYSKRKVGPDYEVFCSFLGCHTIKSAYNCTGIKACKYLHPTIASNCHYSADDSLFALIRDIQRDTMSLSDVSSRTRQTYRYVN